VIVRRAVPDDFPILCELFEEGDLHHREALPLIFERPDSVPRDREYLLAVMKDQGAALVVAEEKGQLLGLLHAFVRETPTIPLLVQRRYVIIDNVVVRHEWRGRGIGTLLMNWAEDWARRLDVPSLELNVFDFNKNAIEFYDRLGYGMQSHRMSKTLD
jgi:diamine N-acetyltransferase